MRGFRSRATVGLARSASSPETPSPMMHAQLPIPAPLGLLCCALLVLLPGVPAMIPGGLSRISVSDPLVQQAAAFAVEEYNARNANDNYFKELRVVEAQSQVVAGVKFYLTMELAKTDCRKTAGDRKAYKEIQNCDLPPKAQQKKLTCRFDVWSRPWLGKMEMTRMSCD